VPVLQAGIFAVGTPAHSYLELDPRGDTEPLALAEALAPLHAPHTSKGGVNLVAEFRPRAFGHVAPGQMPKAPGAAADEGSWWAGASDLAGFRTARCRCGTAARRGGGSGSLEERTPAHGRMAPGR
jgi:hypothetical protein